MIRFNNDYCSGAHPAVLQALAETNDNRYAGYGLDEHCQAAADLIREQTACPNAAVHFLVGGTQVNSTVIAAGLLPYQSVLCADTGHIHVHETGAIEHCGHKIDALPNYDGKITAEQVREKAQGFLDSCVPEHIMQPKMVYISHPTEFGTLYTRAELTALSEVCRKYGIYLYLDGARLGYGLGSAETDVTLKDIAALCDVFTIGGTKCGALFGEAVVISNAALQPYFRSYIKQGGGMLAKGWLLGLQFEVLLRDGLYYRMTAEADRQAMRLRDAFRNRGIPFYLESPTNQQFVILTARQIAVLSEKYIFEYECPVAEDRSCVRFCTAWNTVSSDVDALIADIASL